MKIAQKRTLFQKARPMDTAWYLTRGVDKRDVVCAYKPKGAGTLANSIINLAKPGYNNASPAEGKEPAVDSSGWIFNASEYVYTPSFSSKSLPASYWSALCLFSNAATPGGCLFGLGDYDADEYFYFMPTDETTMAYGIRKEKISVGEEGASGGVVGISDNQVYWMGYPIAPAVQSDGWNINTRKMQIYVGVQDRYISGTRLKAGAIACTVSAFVLYNKPLTKDQMVAISEAMQGL